VEAQLADGLLMVASALLQDRKSLSDLTADLEVPEQNNVGHTCTRIPLYQINVIRRPAAREDIVETGHAGGPKR
jgi:hypothetical protein